MDGGQELRSGPHVCKKDEIIQSRHFKNLILYKEEMYPIPCDTSGTKPCFKSRKVKTSERKLVTTYATQEKKICCKGYRQYQYDCIPCNPQDDCFVGTPATRCPEGRCKARTRPTSTTTQPTSTTTKPVVYVTKAACPEIVCEPLAVSTSTTNSTPIVIALSVTNFALLLLLILLLFQHRRSVRRLRKERDSNRRNALLKPGSDVARRSLPRAPCPYQDQPTCRNQPRCRPSGPRTCRTRTSCDCTRPDELPAYSASESDQMYTEMSAGTVYDIKRQLSRDLGKSCSSISTLEHIDPCSYT